MKTRQWSSFDVSDIVGGTSCVVRLSDASPGHDRVMLSGKNNELKLYFVRVAKTSYRANAFL